MAPSKTTSNVSTTKDAPFRVIVVGAGVAGLSASHCLQKAGIDHIVIEKHKEIAPQFGASISFYPQGARILSQFGCLKAMEDSCVPCKDSVARGSDGRVITRAPFFKYVKENHGQRIVILERRRFLQNMYDCLPNKAPIKLGCQITKVEQNPDGVVATLSDGTVEKADIIMGCDGVHSYMRTIMWDHANKMEPGSITAKEKTSMKAKWKCLVGMGPATPELGERDMTAIFNKGFSFLCITQPTETFWFVFWKLDRPFSWPKRQRYTAQDVDAAAASVAERPLSESLVFGELWRRRHRASLLDLEEGVLDHWFNDRIVLAGDCVHKVTPNAGWGGNMALESVTVLCNHLHAMLERQRGARPSRATLSRSFAAYQAERHGRVVEVMELSSLITRLQAYDSTFLRLYANYITPLLPDHAVSDQIGEVARRGPRLAYGDSLANGFGDSPHMPWADEENGSGGSEYAVVKGKKGYSGQFQWVVSFVTLVIVAMGASQLGWIASVANLK